MPRRKLKLLAVEIVDSALSQPADSFISALFRKYCNSRASLVQQSLNVNSKPQTTPTNPQRTTPPASKLAYRHQTTAVPGEKARDERHRQCRGAAALVHHEDAEGYDEGYAHDANLILSRTHEYRLPKFNPEDVGRKVDLTSRFLGLVVVMGADISRIEVNEGSGGLRMPVADTDSTMEA
ncbi:hypothetical protein Dda_8608 [Drechslerella dactyloides]|uniref:Uncharacterized protein n=1 Tax=Drechslerella dactyloides TaxID=74499 RepID=A0AAD6ITT8_DREDA|nr:hypothetical protein Dda_8608 [Drechslerella dactyloides]